MLSDPEYRRWTVHFASVTIACVWMASPAYANSPGPWFPCDQSQLGDWCSSDLIDGEGVCLETVGMEGCSEADERVLDCLQCMDKVWEPCADKQEGDRCGRTSDICVAKSGDACPDGGDCLHCQYRPDKPCEGKAQSDACGENSICTPSEGMYFCPSSPQSCLACRWSSALACKGKAAGDSCGETEFPGQNRICVVQTDDELMCQTANGSGEGCSFSAGASTIGFVGLILLLLFDLRTRMRSNRPRSGTS
jgi:hypothetical protein